MSDVSTTLIQGVKNGKVTENTSTTTTSEEKNTKGTSELGKDAFLQLLVCQLQNQDPLAPQDNSEFISQLATFSSLEEMQNLGTTTQNTQSYSLVGKEVVVKGESETGAVTFTTGKVDSVITSGSNTKFVINGKQYDSSQLYTVYDSEYYYDINAPQVKKEVEFTFDGDHPKDLTFEVDLGSDVAKASNVAIFVGSAIMSSDYVSLNGNEVTISRDILQELEEGTYSFDVVFDDKNLTTVENKIKVTITNPHPTKDTSETGETEEAEETEELDEAE